VADTTTNDLRHVSAVGFWLVFGVCVGVRDDWPSEIWPTTCLNLQLTNSQGSSHVNCVYFRLLCCLSASQADIIIHHHTQPPCT